MQRDLVFVAPPASAVGPGVKHSAGHCHALVANPLEDEAQD
ncbi:MAG: hypothetical protein ACRC35_05790 [Angustibacter sp.]